MCNAQKYLIAMFSIFSSNSLALSLPKGLKNSVVVVVVVAVVVEAVVVVDVAGTSGVNFIIQRSFSTRRNLELSLEFWVLLAASN